MRLSTRYTCRHTPRPLPSTGRDLVCNNHGRTVIRISVSCAATTDGDVEVAAKAIIGCKDAYLRRNTTFSPEVIAFIEGGPPPPPTEASRRLEPRARELFMEHVNAGRARQDRTHV